MNTSERFARFERLSESGRLLRGAWYDGPPTDDGRERMCWLLALAPECETDSGGDSLRCPAEFLPAWAAHLVVWIDDNGNDTSEKRRRFVSSFRRLAEASVEVQRRLDYAVRAAILRCVLDVAGESREVVERAIALCERAAAGDMPAEEEWVTARATAAAAAWATAAAAAWATAAAAWATETADAAASARAAMAEAAMAASARAAMAEAAMAAMAEAAMAEAAMAEVAAELGDRIVAAIFDAIDQGVG